MTVSTFQCFTLETWLGGATVRTSERGLNDREVVSSTPGRVAIK